MLLGRWNDQHTAVTSFLEHHCSPDRGENWHSEDMELDRRQTFIPLTRVSLSESS